MLLRALRWSLLQATKGSVPLMTRFANAGPLESFDFLAPRSQHPIGSPSAPSDDVSSSKYSEGLLDRIPGLYGRFDGFVAELLFATKAVVPFRNHHVHASHCTSKEEVAFA